MWGGARHAADVAGRHGARHGETVHPRQLVLSRFHGVNGTWPLEILRGTEKALLRYAFHGRHRAGPQTVRHGETLHPHAAQQLTGDAAKAMPITAAAMTS